MPVSPYTCRQTYLKKYIGMVDEQLLKGQYNVEIKVEKVDTSEVSESIREVIHHYIMTQYAYCGWNVSSIVTLSDVWALAYQFSPQEEYKYNFK